MGKGRCMCQNGCDLQFRTAATCNSEPNHDHQRSWPSWANTSGRRILQPLLNSYFTLQARHSPGIRHALMHAKQELFLLPKPKNTPVAPLAAAPLPVAPFPVVTHPVAPYPVAPHPVAPHPVAPYPVASYPIAPYLVVPLFVAPLAVAPLPVAPLAVAPLPVAPYPVAPHPVAPHPIAPYPVVPLHVALLAVAPLAVAPFPVAPHPDCHRPGLLGQVWVRAACAPAGVGRPPEQARPAAPLPRRGPELRRCPGVGRVPHLLCMGCARRPGGAPPRFCRRPCAPPGHGYRSEARQAARAEGGGGRRRRARRGGGARRAPCRDAERRGQAAAQAKEPSHLAQPAHPQCLCVPGKGGGKCTCMHAAPPPPSHSFCTTSLFWVPCV
eukprot:359985-Chlamydomonas_euryale.AAC.18